MADREKILRFFKAGGDEELAGKLIDLADQARRNRRYMVSDFMDPHGINVADIVASNYTQITMKSFGGFQNAERMRIAYVVDDFYGEPDFAIAALLVTWDKRYYDVGHRDVLGALRVWAAAGISWETLSLPTREPRWLLTRPWSLLSFPT